MARRLPRRARSRPPPSDPSSHRDSDEAEELVSAEPKTEFEDVAVRAARLGVTVEKVLREYAWIAFADLRHIVDWDAEGLHVKGHLSKANAAPISEISAGGTGKGPLRVKLYDKKAALDAIARHLGMFTPTQRQQEDSEWATAAEDAREELARWLARIAAEDNKG